MLYSVQYIGLRKEKNQEIVVVWLWVDLFTRLQPRFDMKVEKVR